MVSDLTGFEHTEVGGMGFGTLAYTWKQARWDADGSLESWEDRRGYGLGLLFQDAEWGNAEGTQGWSRSVLLGAFGYREIGAKRYLKLLWIPIPV